MKEQIRKEVIDIINGIVEADKITEDSKDIDIDSLQAMEVVVALEKKYNIKLKEEDLPKLTSLDNIAAVVLEKKSGNK